MEEESLSAVKLRGYMIKQEFLMSVCSLCVCVANPNVVPEGFNGGALPRPLKRQSGGVVDRRALWTASQ